MGSLIANLAASLGSHGALIYWRTANESSQPRDGGQGAFNDQNLFFFNVSTLHLYGTYSTKNYQ